MSLLGQGKDAATILASADLIPDVVAFVGILVFCAGMHLLWLSRRDILGWIEEFIRLFRASVRQVADPASATGGSLEIASGKPQKKHTARIALGVLLAFFVAPMLITLGLGF
jgi:hypothetical protein